MQSIDCLTTVPWRARTCMTDELLMQVLAMTSSERIMGAAFVNHWLTSAVGWTIAVGILAINASDVYEFASHEVAGRPWVLGLLIAAVALYLMFVAYLTIGPLRYGATLPSRTALTKCITPNTISPLR